MAIGVAPSRPAQDANQATLGRGLRVSQLSVGVSHISPYATDISSHEKARAPAGGGVLGRRLSRVRHKRHADDRVRPGPDLDGGVGVGATLDSAALVSNPAGIVDLDRRLDAGFGLFVPKPSYAATGTPLPPGSPPGFPAFVAEDGTRFRTDRGPSPIPFVGVVLPIART